ncbi:hypothetical protein LXA43DRAFT_1042411 [Ganoderma leucocontextum]|nr:hypothetical protein LXA43DRAFT_1042389 [Ganoderma leucocontextum]KAI1784467.1 hypothetical protein LXA43DRAFT_1042411 [Ganoderma leucocontextum]
MNDPIWMPLGRRCAAFDQAVEKPSWVIPRRPTVPSVPFYVRRPSRLLFTALRPPSSTLPPVSIAFPQPSLAAGPTSCSSSPPFRALRHRVFLPLRLYTPHLCPTSPGLAIVGSAQHPASGDYRSPTRPLLTSHKHLPPATRRSPSTTAPPSTPPLTLVPSPAGDRPAILDTLKRVHCRLYAEQACTRESITGTHTSRPGNAFPSSVERPRIRPDGLLRSARSE